MSIIIIRWTERIDQVSKSGLMMRTILAKVFSPETLCTMTHTCQVTIWQVPMSITTTTIDNECISRIWWLSYINEQIFVVQNLSVNKVQSNHTNSVSKSLFSFLLVKKSTSLIAFVFVTILISRPAKKAVVAHPHDARSCKHWARQHVEQCHPCFNAIDFTLF